MPCSRRRQCSRRQFLVEVSFKNPFIRFCDDIDTATADTRSYGESTKYTIINNRKCL